MGGFYPFVATIGGIVPPLPVASGGTGATTAAGALAALPLPWIPADNVLLAATGDLDGTGSFVPTAGILYLAKLTVRASFTFTNVNYIVRTAGAGASTGSFVGLYSSAGTLLSGSADIGVNLATAADYATPLTSAQALTAGTFVWVALLTNLATTQPTMDSYASTTFTVPNLNLTAATARSASFGTAQTVLPASFTPSSLAPGGSCLWFGAS